MLVSTPVSVDQFASAVDDEINSPVDGDNLFAGDGDDATQITEAQSEPPELTPEAPAKPPELTPEDLAERLWWDKCETLAKIKDCARMIQEVEGEVDGYQEQIKEAKEVLKGQQALLARYSSQLADIMDGRPLPTNPNAPAESASDPATTEGQTSGVWEDWRDYPTKYLLDGVKGLGPKKLDAITEEAPTVGKLEDLRGQASMAHKPFKDVLPKGCGESMADEIENRLIEHIAKYSAAEDEAEDEKSNFTITVDTDKYDADNTDEYDDVG